MDAFKFNGDDDDCNHSFFQSLISLIVLRKFPILCSIFRLSMLEKSCNEMPFNIVFLRKTSNVDEVVGHSRLCRVHGQEASAFVESGNQILDDLYTFINLFHQQQSLSLFLTLSLSLSLSLWYKWHYKLTWVASMRAFCRTKKCSKIP